MVEEGGTGGCRHGRTSERDAIGRSLILPKPSRFRCVCPVDQRPRIDCGSVQRYDALSFRRQGCGEGWTGVAGDRDPIANTGLTERLEQHSRRNGYTLGVAMAICILIGLALFIFFYTHIT